MTARLVRKPRPCYSVSTCKIAVMKPKAVLESTRIFIRFPAARVNPPLRESASGLSTASAVMPMVRFTCCARSTRSKYQIWGLKRRTRLHDVHVCKRMSFAGSAGSICKLIQMWELLGHKPVCTRMKGIGGHVIPSSTCKIAVMKPKAVLESTRIFIRFPAARVNPPLRESASGLSTASAVMPVVRFTCCKQLSKLPIGCFLLDLPTPNITFGA